MVSLSSCAGSSDEEVQLCAFHILAEADDDLRKLPLHLRKAKLERLLARRPEGIFVNPFGRGEIGPELFRAACRMGLEGLVSKHRDRPYQGGRCKDWIKVKNRTHLSIQRVLNSFGSNRRFRRGSFEQAQDLSWFRLLRSAFEPFTEAHDDRF
jgi:ATP-dependent DNA ligase